MPIVVPFHVPDVIVPTEAREEAVVKPERVVNVALVVAANVVALPTDVTSPVRLAFVVTVPAVSPAAVPVMFVPTKAEGVPSAGVTSVGLVARTTLPEPVVAALEAEVTNSLPFTVRVEIVYVPGLPFTVANVAAAAPGPVAVTSPVREVIALPFITPNSVLIPIKAPATVADVDVKLLYVVVSPTNVEPAFVPPVKLIVPAVGVCVPMPLVSATVLVGLAAFHVAISPEIVLEPVNVSVTSPAAPGLLAVMVTDVDAPAGVPT